MSNPPTKQQQQTFMIIFAILMLIFYIFDQSKKINNQNQEEKFVTFADKAEILGGELTEPLNDTKSHERELLSVRNTADSRYAREEAFLSSAAKKTPLLNSRLRVDPIAETFNIDDRHEVSNSLEITNGALNDDRRFTYKTHGPPIFKTQNQLLSVARN